MMKSILDNLAVNGFTINIEVASDLSICGKISLDGNHRNFYLTNKDFTLIEWFYDHSTGTDNEEVLLEVLTDDEGLVCAMTKEIFDVIKGEELYLESLMEGSK